MHGLTGFDFDVVEELAAGRLFSYAKYGDGERMWLLGDDLTNCDGHGAYPEAAAALRESLLRWRGREQGTFVPEAFLVVERRQSNGQPHPLAARDAQFLRWIQESGLESLRWARWNQMITRLGRETTIGVEFEMVTVLKRLPVVLVGPEYLMHPVEQVNTNYVTGLTGQRKQHPTRPLSAVFPVRHFVPVSARDCWLDHDRVLESLQRIARDEKARPLAVLMSCSLLSNVLIGELHDTLGQDCWLIDTGSIWDPFVGLTTRDYHLPITPRLARLMRGMGDYDAA